MHPGFARSTHSINKASRRRCQRSTFSAEVWSEVTRIADPCLILASALGGYYAYVAIHELPLVRGMDLYAAFMLFGAFLFIVLTSQAQGYDPSRHRRLRAHAVADYAVRHRVKPGMIGGVQIDEINGLRGDVDALEKGRARVEYDLESIERWSLWRDLKMLLLTLPTIWSCRDAY